MQTSLLPHRKSARRVNFWPDVTPLAGIALLLVFLYAGHGTFRYTEGPSVSLPRSTPICCSDSDGPFVVITLNRAGQLFIRSERQAEIFKQLASRQGLTLSDTEYQKLAALPYVATSVTDLPAYLALTLVERQVTLPLKLQQGVPFAQVADFIKIARSMSSRWLSCYLRIDQDMPYSQVKLLFDKMGELNIHYFHLITETKPVDLQAAEYPH